MADLTGMLQAAAGAAGAAEGAYIEDVFSTYLYAGNGTTGQDITNGIDLAGEGGLVWIKSRSHATNNNLFDTERGNRYTLLSNSTAAQSDNGTTYGLTAFNSDGFSVKDNNAYEVNANNLSQTYASWTFRKAPKFFDVVTYTGTGSARTVSHNLGSVPGCIIVKRTDSTGDWIVYHRANTANPETDYLELNDTAATADDNTMWNDTAPTSTEFTVGTDNDVNASAATYVAYLFAHDAGGFGDDGEQNVVTCGSFTQSSAVNVDVNLGYEPQWVLLKRTSGTSGTGKWVLLDNMRGFFAPSTSGRDLAANASDAEGTISVFLNNNGFRYPSTQYADSSTFVYIAIRRGPMKTPESASQVFDVKTAADNYSPITLDSAIVSPDLLISFKNYIDSTNYNAPTWHDRLRGIGSVTISGTDQPAIYSNQTIAETPTSGTTTPSYLAGVIQNKVYFNSGWGGYEAVLYGFRRAPNFFDIVCYTGTGSATTITHNLGVIPELIIVKNRDQTDAWQIYAGDATDYLVLNTTAATADNVNRWNDTAPTASEFTIGTAVEVNTSTEKYVAYLFASLAGVSKVGTYTGTGTTLAIDCGFSAGARFVMIKRTDSTGGWYVWDSARGIVSGNDPFLFMNTNDVQNSSTDYIDPSSAGFEISSTAPAAINASGGTFIYFSVA